MLIGFVGQHHDRITIIHHLENLIGSSAFYIAEGEGAHGSRLPDDRWPALARNRYQFGAINIHTPECAARVRQQGGTVWHLLGRVSMTIPIVSQDLMVAVSPEKRAGRILSVAEAFTEMLARSFARQSA